MTGQNPNSSPLEDAAVSGSIPAYESITLFEVLTMLAQQKLLIAKVTGILMLIGLVLCFALPTRYTASTSIMPPQQTQSGASMIANQLTGSGGFGAPTLAAASGFGLKNPNDLYIGLLKSRPIADAIIGQFDLVKVYGSRDMTAAREKLASFTEISADTGGLITIHVTDRKKQRAAEMANAYTEGLRNLTKNLAVTEASQRRLFYEDQMKQAKESLLAAELAFEQVQQQKGLVQPDEQAKAMIQSLAELRAKVAAKQVDVQSLRMSSTEQNPDVLVAEQQLASLQAEVAHMEQSNNSKGFSDLSLGDVPGAGLEYLRAEHELKYQQALFDLLIKQFDAARLDEAKDAAVIQVVDRRSHRTESPLRSA